MERHKGVTRTATGRRQETGKDRESGGDVNDFRTSQKSPVGSGSEGRRLGEESNSTAGDEDSGFPGS